MTIQLSAGTHTILPANPLPLAGSGKPTSNYEHVEALPEANYLIVHELADAPALIVSVDALFGGEAFAAVLRERLAGAILPDRIMILASHTHFAPAMDLGKPLLGAGDAGHVIRVADQLATRVIGLLNRRPTDCGIRIGSDLANHSINRRRRKTVSLTGRSLRLGRTVMAPNPSGPRDETITVLLASDLDGHPRAVLWNYACHPVSHPDADTLSPHFPGRVRRAIRTALRSPRLPVLFAQGFSGNTRPNAPSILRAANRGLRRAALGPGFSQFSAADYDSWTGTLSEVVVGAVGRASPEPSTPLIWAEASLPSSRLVAERDERQLRFQAFSVGHFTLVAAPCEPVAEHALWIRGRYPGRQLALAGCANDVACYLPTEEMVSAEGGYEVTGFCRTFGVQSLAPGAPATFREALDQVVRGQ